MGPGIALALASAICGFVLAGCPRENSPCTPADIRDDAAAPVEYARIADLATVTKLLTDLRRDPGAADAIRQQFGAAATLTFRTVAAIGVTYLILDAPDAITIAVPGTDDPEDVKFDLETQLTPDDVLGIPLDRGFRDVAQGIFDDVRPLLPPDRPIDVTGYSLGGAAAAILALYLREDGVALGAVTTFGQPQFTDAAGAAAIVDFPLLRFVAANDPIPRLPQSGYAHTGPEIRLLDGAYIAFVPADQASCVGTVTADAFDAARADHTTYVPRTQSKVGVAIVQVPYGESAEFIEPATEPATAPRR